MPEILRTVDTRGISTRRQSATGSAADERKMESKIDRILRRKNILMESEAPLFVKFERFAKKFD